MLWDVFFLSSLNSKFYAFLYSLKKTTFLLSLLCCMKSLNLLWRAEIFACRYACYFLGLVSFCSVTLTMCVYV